MHNALLDSLTDYPFQRLRDLLDPVEPAAGLAPIALTVGEPQHAPPALLNQVLAENGHLWNKYPPTPGTPDLCAAIAEWLTRRYHLPDGFVDPTRHVLPVAGTREALYLIAQTVISRRQDGRQPVVLLPNPLYQAYLGGAVMAGAEPVLLPATVATGHLPDLDALTPDLLARTALFYLCSPANPQGTIADAGYLRRALTLAREHDFILILDECYAEIYDADPPVGGLETCTALDAGLNNLLVFHSLSKRSSAAGLRSGFVAGEASLIKSFNQLRAYGGASLPLPVQAASAALWREESHVVENRAAYGAKIDVAEEVLGGQFGFYRPPGGFFLWLNVGDGEAATREIWARGAVRVMPGGYFAKPGPDGDNPGAVYIRVALVQDAETIRTGLTRLRAALEAGL